MNDKKNTVSFSGHRESKLPRNPQARTRMEEHLEDSIKTAVNNGYHTFYTGLCNGFDLIAAEKVLALHNSDLTLVGVVPFRGQEFGWCVEEQEQYRAVCNKCHDLVVLNEAKVSGCYYQRNRFMVDHSSLLLCYCSSKQGGTAYTLQYAEKEGNQIINLHQKP